MSSKHTQKKNLKEMRFREFFFLFKRGWLFKKNNLNGRKILFTSAEINFTCINSEL